MFPVLVEVLTLAGLGASLYMLRKQLRGERGELSEPSVVLTPRARLVGVPNALLGVLFYLGLAVAAPFLHHPWVHAVALAASVLAAAASAVLAYSLLFVTRMPCVFCWTSHVINWIVLAALALHRF
jgi:uncharacterized membrane protein